MKVVVVGAGVAGLGAALALARKDHQVVLLERDAPTFPRDAGEAFEGPRPGIPHFLQPHAFLARAGKELRDHAPDVYSELLTAGADELRLYEKMPAGAEEPADDDLRLIGCRRPVIEWVLRRIVNNEPNVEVRNTSAVSGLAWEERGSEVPRATGVMVSGEKIEADFVVDAMGRSSPLGDWIVDAGGLAPEVESDDCGIVYYARYFGLKEGDGRPAGPWLIGPRAELGYMETGSFWGDNGTFALVQQIRADDRELRVLRHPNAFMASLRAQGAFDSLIGDDISEPITPVLPMGQLRNTLNSFEVDGRLIASGVVAIGDARCHTNPRYAWGLSLALAQAFQIAALCTEFEDDVDTLTTAFEAGAKEWAVPVYRTATATDNERKRYWGGEEIEFRTPDDGLHLFLLMVLPVAGMRDREIFRKAVRRLMLLDDPTEIESNRDLLLRGAKIAGEMGVGVSGGGPSRTELLEVVKGA